jgi:hypothetical protein
MVHEAAERLMRSNPPRFTPLKGGERFYVHDWRFQSAYYYALSTSDVREHKWMAESMRQHADLIPMDVGTLLVFPDRSAFFRAGQIRQVWQNVNDFET